jgi:hypothetical protein
MFKYWGCALFILCILAWRPTALIAVDDLATASLAELLKLYREVGLPLPPKNAKLARFAWGGGNIINGVVQAEEYGLAILIEPNGDQKEAALLSETDFFEGWKPSEWKIIEPTATAGLETPGFRPDILLAIRCHALGWNELAADILERSQKDEPDPEKNK